MADTAHYQTDLKLEEMEKRLSAIYSRAEKEITQTAEDYFSKFAKQDEAKRKLLEQGKITEDEYKKWRKGKVMYGKRFTEMKEQCAKQLLNVNQTALSYVNGELPEVYALNYNALAGSVDGVGGYSFTLVDADTVRNLAVTDTSLLPYKELDPAKDIPWNMKKINAETLQGILQGESMDKIAKRIMNVQEMNKTQAIRSARTIVTGAENKGRQDSYARAEADGIILQKEWLATNDGRTRHSHAALDGAVVDQDKKFDNGLMYPGDPSGRPEEVYNCRCTLVAKVNGFKKAQVQKAMEKGEYNSETIDHQYKETEAMNEYDYFSAEQEKFRLDSIRKMAGYDDMEAMKALDALCGTSAEYRGIGDNVPAGWFSGADTKIRLAKDGEFFDKAKTIDAYIERSPKYKGSIYRGLSLDDDTISSFAVGGTFKENGNLSSWTSDRSVASMFAEGRSEELGKKPVIFRTKDPKHGTPASHLSIFGSEESEVLVSNMKDSEYIIEAVTEESGMVIVDMILKGG
jgi:SPP1 gp7 family putative phage head morphogenesis protein